MNMNEIYDMTHADEVIREVPGDCAPTMQSRMGTGGNQVPLVATEPGCYNPSDVQSKRVFSQDSASPTLNGGTTEGVNIQPSVPVRIAIAIEGNGSRPSHQGTGYNTDGASFTLNHVEQHAVAVQTANTGENGKNVNDDGSAYTLDRASSQAVAIGIDQQGGKSSAATSDGVSPTMLSDSHGTPNAVCYKLDSTASNSMKSANPHSGFHEVEYAATLDTTNPNPNKAQGGNMIIQPSALEPTVAIGCDRRNQSVTGEVSKPLGHSATDTDHTPAVALHHIVRRLTPVECERLQGFPDGWTKIPWRTYKDSLRLGVTYESLLNERGMRLREPTTEDCPDSPRYKALGNSWATNCAEYILRRIVAAFRLDMIPDNN